MERVLAEIWATHQIFRTLGFSPDEIYVVPNSIHPVSGARSQAVAVVRGQGRFAITMPMHEHTEEEILAGWADYCARMTKASEQELQAVYERSMACANFPAILAAMHAKGGEIAEQVEAYMHTASAAFMRVGWGSNPELS